MSFVAISNAIKAKLTSIPEIQEVSDFDKAKFLGYPAAVAFPSENRSDFETTASNFRSYVFTIRLHQEQEHKGPEEANNILKALCDKVIDEFEKDYSLGGVVDFCLAIPSIWGYQDRDVGVVRVAEIRLTCNKSASIV